MSSKSHNCLSFNTIACNCSASSKSCCLRGASRAMRSLRTPPVQSALASRVCRSPCELAGHVARNGERCQRTMRSVGHCDLRYPDKGALGRNEGKIWIRPDARRVFLTQRELRFQRQCSRIASTVSKLVLQTYVIHNLECFLGSKEGREKKKLKVSNAHSSSEGYCVLLLWYGGAPSICCSATEYPGVLVYDLSAPDAQRCRNPL